MSTRGIIGTEHDGGFSGRYVHMDSYPTWTGPRLQEAYASLGSVEKVIEHFLRPGQSGYWHSISDDAESWQPTKTDAALLTDTDDCGAEWAWLLSERGIHVVAAMRASGRKAQGLFGVIGEIVWTSVGRVGWQEDVDWSRIQCGADLERCTHYAWVHFPEAEGLTVGTAVWLRRQPPSMLDVKELVVNTTGGRIKLGGSGGLGSAWDPHAWRWGHIEGNQYWWCSVAGGGDVRVFRVIKAGYKLEPDYSGVVPTADGELVVAPGTVLS